MSQESGISGWTALAIVGLLLILCGVAIVGWLVAGLLGVLGACLIAGGVELIVVAVDGARR